MNETTKDKNISHSNSRLDLLKKRAGRCVCKYCGGQLRVRQIMFTSYEDVRIELFCKDCDRIEYGVEPEIYQSARCFVEEDAFNCYPDLDDSGKTKQMTIAKVCEIMTWQDQSLGILAADGFNVAVRHFPQNEGECLTISDEELRQKVMAMQ